MTVRKLANGKYEVDFSYVHPLTGEKERFRKWSPFTSKRKAEKWEAEQLLRMTDRNYWLEKEEREAAESIPTIAAFAPDFLARITGHVAESTIELYRSRLKCHIVPALGDKRLDQVETEDVDDLFASMLRQEYSVNTIESVGVCLGSVFSRATRWGLIEKAHRPDIRPPKQKKSLEGDKPRYFTDSEVTALREAASPKILPMIDLALATGMRIGEVQGVKWADIDFQRKVITVMRAWTRNGMTPPKGREARTVPVTDKTLSALRAHRDSEFAGSEYVFRIDDSEPVHRNKLRSPMEIALRDSGLKGDRVGWHNLRHTYAARLATQGLSLRLIQELLGHSKITVTEKYAHLMPRSTNVAREHLEALGV